MLGTIAPDPTVREFDIAAMVDYLKRNGYRVSKAQKVAPITDQPDVRRCVHCGTTAARTVTIGGRKRADKVARGICTDCYRFGPNLHAVPMRPRDPARMARLLAVWRRAHHRFAARHAEHGGFATSTKQAERLAGRILHAMSREPMERDYTGGRDIFGRMQ
jgi:hypothetical protein